MTATDAAEAGRRLEWQRAEVREILAETPRVKSLVLDVTRWPSHLPGQHVDIRLTAEDGYQAQRSYSIASPPEDRWVTLTVERIENGDVSPYLLDELRVGDQFELRGPVGGYFVWTAAAGGPINLIAGGSGIAPLMSMLRHRDRRGDRTSALLLYSSRELADIIYRNELEAMERRDRNLRIVTTLTRTQPDGWAGHRGRIDKDLLATTCFAPTLNPKTFVCGPTPFVENIATFLVELGHDPLSTKTERFGPSGES
jgi:ferredoxin-NADP reductase